MFETLKKELNDFRTFAMKGNIVDMAVGIIIGAGFTSIVNSLVKDIIMPPLGWLMGKTDFSNLFFVLPNSITEAPAHYDTIDAAQKAGAATVNYGIFINQIISFIIVAYSVFLLIKCINKLQAIATKKNEECTEATTKQCPRCTSQIPINATKCPCCTANI